MRKATSRDGEYLPSSMAFTVCLVTPILSASSCWVISPRSKRSRRIVFRILVSTSGVAAVQHNLSGELDCFGTHDGEENGLHHQPEVIVLVPQAQVNGPDRSERAHDQHIERRTRCLELDQLLAF